MKLRLLRTKRLSEATGFVSVGLILALALAQGNARTPRASRLQDSSSHRVGVGLCACASPCRLPLPPRSSQRDISSSLPPGSKLLAAVQADLDNDGVREWACLTKLGPRFDLVVLERRGKDYVVAGRNRVAAPWHFEIGDVDGDGKPEILIGVRKKSPLDRTMANRPFFYFWDGRLIRPKWLGSRLARRFSDLALADLDANGIMELYAIEPLASQTVRVSLYRWRAFGFRWVGAATAPAGKWHLCGTDRGLFLVGSNGKLSVELTRDSSKPLSLAR